MLIFKDHFSDVTMIPIITFIGMIIAISTHDPLKILVKSLDMTGTVTVIEIL